MRFMSSHLRAEQGIQSFHSLDASIPKSSASDLVMPEPISALSHTLHTFLKCICMDVRHLSTPSCEYVLASCMYKNHTTIWFEESVNVFACKDTPTHTPSICIGNVLM